MKSIDKEFINILDEYLLERTEARDLNEVKAYYDMIRKHWDTSRVIKITVDLPTGEKGEFKIHSDHEFNLKIESEDE